ncbi:MAG: hypothetical protein EOP84_27460, partial [Verrucomicrobiaceae bacterium]
MKRKILKFFYGLALVGLAVVTAVIAWFAFYPAVPNTDATRKGFSEMTGLSPSEVTDIYYDASYDFHGDYSKYLRFTYHDEEWLNRFLDRRSHLSPSDSFR